MEDPHVVESLTTSFVTPTKFTPGIIPEQDFTLNDKYTKKKIIKKKKKKNNPPFYGFGIFGNIIKPAEEESKTSSGNNNPFADYDPDIDETKDEL